MLKKISEKVLQDKPWVLVPFIEENEEGKPNLFNKAILYQTENEDFFLLALQHFDSAKILHYQAFFTLKHTKVAGYPEEYEIKAASANRFRCGWREKDENKIPGLKKKLINFLFKK